MQGQKFTILAEFCINLSPVRRRWNEILYATAWPHQPIPGCCPFFAVGSVTGCCPFFAVGSVTGCCSFFANLFFKLFGWFFIFWCFCWRGGTLVWCILGTWASRVRYGRSTVWIHFFSRVLISKLVSFGVLGAPLGANFGVLGPPWATILRVWGYPWADLVRSCRERPLVPDPAPPFWSIFEPKWEAKEGPNWAKIWKKTVENWIKKSLRFWIVFLLDFCWFLVPKVDWNLNKHQDP